MIARSQRCPTRIFLFSALHPSLLSFMYDLLTSEAALPGTQKTHVLFSPAALGARPDGSSTSLSGLTERNVKKLRMVSCVRNHLPVNGNGTIVCIESISNDTSKPVSFASSTARGNLSRHLGLKHGIRKGTGARDITETTFSNRSSILRYNVMDPETASIFTQSLAR